MLEPVRHDVGDLVDVGVYLAHAQRVTVGNGFEAVRDAVLYVFQEFLPRFQCLLPEIIFPICKCLSICLSREEEQSFVR